MISNQVTKWKPNPVYLRKLYLNPYFNLLYLLYPYFISQIYTKAFHLIALRLPKSIRFIDIAFKKFFFFFF